MIYGNKEKGKTEENVKERKINRNTWAEERGQMKESDDWRETREREERNNRETQMGGGKARETERNGKGKGWDLRIGKDGRDG